MQSTPETATITTATDSGLNSQRAAEEASGDLITASWLIHCPSLNSLYHHQFCAVASIIIRRAMFHVPTQELPSDKQICRAKCKLPCKSPGPTVMYLFKNFV